MVDGYPGRSAYVAFGSGAAYRELSDYIGSFTIGGEANIESVRILGSNAVRRYVVDRSHSMTLDTAFYGAGFSAWTNAGATPLSAKMDVIIDFEPTGAPDPNLLVARSFWEGIQVSTPTDNIANVSGVAAQADDWLIGRISDEHTFRRDGVVSVSSGGNYTRGDQLTVSGSIDSGWRMVVILRNLSGDGNMELQRNRSGNTWSTVTRWRTDQGEIAVTYKPTGHMANDKYRLSYQAGLNSQRASTTLCTVTPITSI